jgi:ubiquinone/menaquinone biosynthesis C-methylase UbiE
MQKEHLKEQVKNYWNKASCGTEFIHKKKYTKEYFEEIERFRYTIEPEIFSFAQFTRFSEKKILEVGVGAGTDFLQWVRAGAKAYGIDLTQEAVDNVNHRLNVYGLKAKDVCVTDAESIPYPDNSFDLVYSWGVIHHSPNTDVCLKEIIRVAKFGGMIKLMVYNRRSLFAFYRWILCSFLRGKIFKNFTSVLYHNQESPGTKAYTVKEMQRLFLGLPVNVVKIKATVTNHDLLYYKGPFWRRCAKLMAFILGWDRVGWFMTVELKKTVDL